MKILRTLSALLPVLVVVYVALSGNLVIANTGKGANVHHSASGEASNSSAGDPRTTKGVIAEVSKLNGPNIVYAPRDTVDMTRLVLEVTRDQAMHTNHLIELATQVILVLFGALGLVAGMFGIHTFSDLRKKAKTLEERSASLEKTSLKLEEEVKAKFDTIDESMKLHGTAVSELVAGRLAIDHAALFIRESELKDSDSGDQTKLISSLLIRGVNQIENALSTYHSELSIYSKMRAYMDLGFAKKRLQDYSGAYQEAINGLDLLNSDATIPKLDKRKASFNYNAACYACLQNQAESALKHLQDALKLDPTLKTQLRQNDPDFKLLQDNDRFKNLFSG